MVLQWMNFHPIMGATFRHFSENLYEMVLEKKPEIEKAQFIFQSFSYLMEWPMKDLFSKHPTRDGLWRFQRRTDDIVLLSTGRSIDSSLMKASVSAHSKVKATLLCGSGRSQTCLLVEVVDPPKGSEVSTALLEDIWQSVESSNKLMDALGRVRMSMILFATHDNHSFALEKKVGTKSHDIRGLQRRIERLVQCCGRLRVGGLIQKSDFGSRCWREFHSFRDVK